MLGVNWMKNVSPICFDFNKMKVTFENENRRMTLTGTIETRLCKMISRRSYKRYLEISCHR